MNRSLVSITSVSIAFIFAACGGSSPSTTASSQGGSPSVGGDNAGGNAGNNAGGNNAGGNAGNNAGGNAGNNAGGNAGNNAGGNNAGGNNAGGSAGSPQGGSAGNSTGGASITGGAPGTSTGGKPPTGGSASTSTGGKAPTGGSGGGNTGGSPTTSTGGKPATGGTGAGTTGGTPSTGGTTAAATTAAPAGALVTSASGAYWKTATWTVVTSGTADVTVNDTSTAQTWDGFGGAFNELGWSFLTSTDMQNQALQLLFGTDGCNFAWGRIPMGASDYATNRYTDDDPSSNNDPTPNSSGSTRPAADTSLANFSTTRDTQKLIPYIKAAQAVKSDIRFWASPWTPPVWMKTGYKTNSGADSSKAATKPSYYDGGTMSNTAANLTAYAQYYTKWVQAYKAQGINVELVSPQNEPGYDQNYPSCLWDSATYTAWIGQYLGPAMQTLGVKVMLGTLSNNTSGADESTANAVLANSTAKGFLSVAGVQWGVLDDVNGGTKFGSLPIWATEHKCGNYPWNPSGYPTYNSTQAPNDQAYGVESWGYIRDAITKGKVTAYNAWNMVLDTKGLGIDTTRDWKQDALLVASGTSVTATPAYYVFRHFSQFVAPGATVVGTSGGDAVAFKNTDGTLVAVIYNSGGAKTSIVKIGGKLLSFSMPGAGWATVKYAP